MSAISQTVGNRIRSYRKKRGLSQEILAEKADLHPTYVSLVERGIKNVSIDTLGRLLSALDVSFGEFFQCMENAEDKPSYAVQCYDLVHKQDISEQARMYHILWEAEQLMEAARLGFAAK